MINVIEIILISLIIVVLALNLFLIFVFLKLKKRVNLFFKGKKASDLEEAILRQIAELEKQEGDIKKILERIASLEKSSKISFQKIGMKRFNPFGDVGGNQSFVLAILDKKNDGFVVSSLYTREGNRVYAKALKDGKSEYPLSKEEEEIIFKAIENKEI